MTPLLYTVRDAARMLGVSPKTVYRLMQSGDIESVIVGEGDRARRIPAEALKDYVESLRASRANS